MRPGFDPQVRKIPWRRKWQPTLLPGKFHGWRGLVGYSPWALKESDTTEQLQCSLERSRDFPHPPANTEDALEKEMLTYSIILAWKILWIEELGRLQSIGLQNTWT